MTCKTIDTIPCEAGRHKLCQKAAAEFPTKLKEAHNDTIKIREGAVYRGNATTLKQGETVKDYYIPVVCTVCDHQWGQTPNSLVTMKRGCPECSKEKNNIGRKGLEVIGKQSRRVSTPEERHQAKVLYDELGNYAEVARRLGRTQSTIIQWLSKDYKRKHSARCKAKKERDRESGYQKVMSATYQQTENGKVTRQRATHKRRALEYHCADVVFLPGHPDADYQGFVSYDIWDLVEPTDYPLFTFDGADDDVAKRKVQQEKLTKISGEKYSLEHLVPLSQGGVHCPENFANRALVLNCQKGDKRLQTDDELFCKRLFNIK